jgi:hypothetical protein
MIPLFGDFLTIFGKHDFDKKKRNKTDAFPTFFFSIQYALFLRTIRDRQT